MTLQEKVNELNNKVGKLDTIECIKMMTEEGKTIFTTSFGYEDQVISDILFRNELSVEVVTLDTGRLFKETYSVFYQTIEKYRKPIKVFFPDTEATEKLMTEKGPFSFYESTANRHECCNIRKVELQYMF
jgi:phosphoadenosine phosphosulfate reductase